MDGDLQITFRPRVEAPAEVRREVRAWLAGCVAPQTVVHELVASTDELFPT